MITGTLIIYASVADQAAPLAGVRITVQDESGAVVSRLTTDSTGATTALSLPAPMPATVWTKTTARYAPTASTA